MRHFSVICKKCDLEFIVKDVLSAPPCPARAAYLRGKAEGLEEAAKIADSFKQASSFVDIRIIHGNSIAHQIAEFENGPFRVTTVRHAKKALDSLTGWNNQ